MHASFLKSPLFWASIVLLAAFLGFKLHKNSDPHLADAYRWHELAPNAPAEQGWLIKPFISPTGDSGIALDGGEIPILDYRFPILKLGEESLHPLHLVLLHDWNSEKSRQILSALRSLAPAETGSDIPPLSLVILPASTSPDSREIDQMLLQVHSMTARVETFPDLIRILCDPSAIPGMEIIREFLAEAEPDLLERIDATSKAADQPVDPVIAAAESQTSRNASLFGLRDAPQLLAMHQVLTHLPDQDELLSFLASSFSYQQAYLASPEGRIPISPTFGCRCEIPSHRHESWKSAVSKRFPQLHASPDSSFNFPDDPQNPSMSTEITGPQFQLTDPSPIAIPNPQNFPATHTIHYENIGTETLDVLDIDAGDPAITLERWDRKVAPGERGSMTIRLQKEAFPGQAQNNKSHAIWVKTNSAAMTDATRGDEVILQFP